MKKLYTFALLLSIQLIVSAQSAPVWTQRYNNTRLGWNDREILLTPASVDSAHFGLLFSRVVDDQIYAQPLFLPGIFINGRIHDVVFVATVNNTVYAFDATDSASAAPLWSVNLTPAGARVIRHTDMTGACGGNYNDFSGNMGIVGTPVIDTLTGTMYVVARDKISGGGAYQQYLHALDILTGAERPNSPVYITATFPGDGDGSVNHVITFHQQRQNQRPALLLHNGVVYICWASHCDWGPYHGWMIGYDAGTLQQVSRYNNSPDGSAAGIWMSGMGPAVDDSGYIYLTTGNGTVGDATDPNYFRDRGESIVKLIPSGDSMIVVDFFTPANYQHLESYDLDYGVSGPIIIPNTNLSLSGSKEGIQYLVDNSHMGRYSAGNDSVLQILYANSQNINDRHIHGTPVYYKYTAASDTECVYVWAESDSLCQFFFNRATGLFDTTLTIKGNILLDVGMPGGILSVSSNGTNPGTGIVWATHPLSGDANQAVRPGKFEAFDARDVRRLLWSSEMNHLRDSVGNFAKFNTPVVANGRVYVPTFSNKLLVYGLLDFANTHGELIPDKPVFELYPNPASESISIKYTLPEEASGLSASLFDVRGRLVIQQELSSAKGSHVHHLVFPVKLPAGLYEIRISTGNAVLHTQKITIQK